MPSFLTALFSLPILISALLIIRRYATTLISQGKRNGVPRPPLVANWLPFIGSALQMGGGDAFWTNVK